MSESALSAELVVNDGESWPSSLPQSPNDTATRTAAAAAAAAASSTTNTNSNSNSNATDDDLSKPTPLVTSSSSSAIIVDAIPPIGSSRCSAGIGNAAALSAQTATATPTAITFTVPTSTTAATSAATTTTTTAAPALAAAALVFSAAPTPAAPTTITNNVTTIPPKQRLYRSSADTGTGGKNKWVTREIAALGFLLGIPLEAEASIVKQGWLLQQEQLREKNNKDNRTINSSSIMDESGRADSDSNYDYNGTATGSAAAAAAKGHWWEKHLQGEDVQAAAAAAAAAASPSRTGGVLESTRQKGGTYETELERPPSASAATTQTATAFNYAPPGRRLEGDEAVRVQIPLTTRTLTKQRYIARQAALRQWELQTAHGLTTTSTITAVAIGEKMNQNNTAVGPNVSKSVPSTPGTTTLSSISMTSAAASSAATTTTTATTTASTTTTTTTRTIPSLLDGRLFFSAGGSYPVSVFSVIRYEPRKEELLRRRQKLEAMGGGGSQFVMPTRDWRGISYRSLLPRLDNDSSNKKKTYHHHRHDHHYHHNRHRRPKNFNRFLRNQNEDDDDALVGDDANSYGINTSRHSKQSNKSDENGNDSSTDDGSDSSSLSDDSDDLVYAPGILDDPNMVLGRHRTVMIGDRVTGPMVSSTIQFVKPALLKAELNKQFRERFDGWEPPRAARKYIGARVVDGAYKLMDPKEQSDDYQQHATTSALAKDDNLSRNRQGSIASASETPTGGVGAITSAASSAPTLSKEKQLRMPPSLTLSKIRSLKRQALAACVQARLEIGTVALACVYFERLCLDCRVDKSNRRLSFAACVLLAAKLNEPNVGLVMKSTADGGAATANISNNNNVSNNDNMSMRLQSLIRPNRRSSIMFASLLEFFTEDWNLALPVVFSAEWGVFAALGFSLHAKPSQVSFHFKRLMKTLEWNPRHYLGSTMFHQWQDALDFEEKRNKKRERRKEKKQRRKEEQLLNLHLELVSLKTGEHGDSDGEEPSSQRPKPPAVLTTSTKSTVTASAGFNIANSRQEKSSARIMGSGMRLLNRFGMRRIVSQDKMDQQQISASQQLTGSMMTTLSSFEQIGERRSSHQQGTSSALTTSPSMPSFGGAAVAVAGADVVVDGAGIIAIDILSTEVDSETSSIGSAAKSDKGIII